MTMKPYNCSLACLSLLLKCLAGNAACAMSDSYKVVSLFAGVLVWFVGNFLQVSGPPRALQEL